MKTSPMDFVGMAKKAYADGRHLALCRLPSKPLACGLYVSSSTLLAS